VFTPAAPLDEWVSTAYSGSDFWQHQHMESGASPACHKLSGSRQGWESVRFGSQADISASHGDVCFVAEVPQHQKSDELRLT
jgi:hypothetical protein